MKKSTYVALKKELPAISKAVKVFPDQLQEKVFDILVKEYLGAEPSSDLDRGAGRDRGKGDAEHEIPGVASLSEKGDFNLTVRDPKATTKADAVKRLVYVSIRAYLRLKADESNVSRKTIVNPTLTNWRVNDGNARHFLAEDKGIQRQGDLLSLDRQATQDADRYIKDIQDPKIEGTWKAGGSSTKRKKKKKTVTAKSNKRK